MHTSIKFIAGAVTLFILHKILTRQTKTATPIAKTPSNLPEIKVVDIGVLQEVQPDAPVREPSKKAPETNKKTSEKNKRAKDAAYQLARVDALRAMLEEDPNYTLEELGKHFGVTRERIRQILVRHNIEKGYGQHNRRSYAIATFEDKVLVGDMVQSGWTSCSTPISDT